MSRVVSVDLIAAAKLSADVPRGYSDEDLKTALIQYEKFLLLAAKNRREHLVPTKEIDMMWHLHMLHPRAYYKDCMDMFGDILDHNGGYSLRNGETKGLAAALQITAALWEQEFGEGYSAAKASCPADKVSCIAPYISADKIAGSGTRLASCMSGVQGSLSGFIRA